MFAKVFDTIANKEVEIYCHPYLYDRWNGLKEKVVRKNQDRVYTVVGMERSGKSSWVFQQAKIIDPNFGLDRICFTPNQFLDTLKKTPPGGVVVFDEAFRGFSSISSQSKVNKSLVQAMMEVGKRNLIIFIILPSFNYLTPYIATHRSQGLFQIYAQESKNYRAWKFFSRKKQPKIYYLGKRNFGIFPVMKTKHKSKFFIHKVKQSNGKVIGYPYETFDLAGYEGKKDMAFNETPVKEVREEQTVDKARDFIIKGYTSPVPCKSIKELAAHYEVSQDYFYKQRRKFEKMNRTELENYDFTKEQAFKDKKDAKEGEEGMEKDSLDMDIEGKSSENEDLV